MAGVPGPLRRVARNRARLIAVTLLALVGLAAAGINVTAADRLQALLDDNWRGAYDILVTAEGSEVAGLLAPNSLAAGSEAMTLDHLETIRSVDGIEVAAPIGEVIVPGLSAKYEEIAVPVGAAGASHVPQAFRVTLTRHTDDGLGERLVSKESFRVVIDETEHPEPESQPCIIDGYEVDPDEYPLLATSCEIGPRHSIVNYELSGGSGGGGRVDDNNVLFSLSDSVRPNTRVTIVDPVAERALLGEAGDFLKPLTALSAEGPASAETIAQWVRSSDDEFTRAFVRQRGELDFRESGFEGYLEEFERLHEENGSTFEYEAFEQKYVPLVVRKTAPAALTVTIDVEAFGAAPPSTTGSFPFELPAELTEGVAGTTLGSVTVDASSMLNPFNDFQVRIPWPGTPTEVSEGQVSPYGMNIYELGIAQAPDFTVASDDTDGVVVDLRSSGYLAPSFPWGFNPNSSVIANDGAKAGMESAFVSELKFSGVNGNNVGYAAVPVGEFSLDGVAGLQSELSHVPLGAYGAVGSTLVEGSSDVASGAVRLKSSVSGLGLVSPDTVAIASIRSLAAMGQKAPINAVRVRVAGVDSYSAAGITKIAAVVDQLERLGFVATVVAGSSPTDVTVHVHDYAFGVSDPAEEQRIGYLGAVTQRWSELGAAARADLAVSVSSLGVLAVALGASALLLASVQLASVPGRRAQASVMRTIGWKRRRIIRWMAAEESVSLALIVLAGVAALIVSGMRPTVGLVVGASVVALVLSSALAVTLGARPMSDRKRLPWFGKLLQREQELDAWVTSSFRFSVRQLVVHRMGMIVQLLATVVVAVSAAAVTVTILEGRVAAGASALGDFASSQALISQAGLGLVALVAGIILAVIARRIGLDRRREQWVTMRAMGFGSGQLRRMQVVEGLLIGVPSVVLAGAAAWLFLGEIAAELREASLPVAVVAAAVLTVILVLTSWREKR